MRGVIERAPTLETERLRLREHVEKDLDDSWALWSDPQVVRYIGGEPFSREDVWSRLLRYVGHWAVCGYGYWVIEERATGRFVGELGFIDGRREIEPSFLGVPEGGWVLMPWAHGKGMAAEALEEALRWIHERPSVTRTVCMIEPENVASVKLARKCGYELWCQTTHHSDVVDLYERKAR